MSTMALPGSRRPGVRRRRRITWGSPAVYVVAAVVVALTIAPVLYLILGGFRSNAQIAADPAGLPHPWNVSNYTDILTSSRFWVEFRNSTVVASATTLGVTVLGLMASFVLARYDFRLRGAMFALFAAGLMFPVTAAITPLFILLKNLGLLNSDIGLILPQIGFGLPTTVIILVPFLRAIPDELEEAATVDGCSRVSFFWRIIVPLAMPGLLTTLQSPRKT